jgi:Bacterial type II/III secretion system short domain
MPRLRIALLLLALLGATSAAADERRVHLYKPQSRSAAELLAPAQAALGDGGSASVETGTNALILIGEPRAVDDALALLAQLDRPLASVILHYESERLEDLAARGVRVDWSVSAGSFQVGNVLAPPGTNLVAVRPFDDKTERRGRLAGMLRVQDGQVGRIETGTALPIVHHVSPWETQTVVVDASSGFEARPQLLGDGRVRVELQPFEASLEPGGAIRHAGAATQVTVAPGETVAIGGVQQSGEQRSRGLGGAERSRSSQDRVLLLRVEVENAPPVSR